jgi:hypothetical protein
MSRPEPARPAAVPNRPAAARPSSRKGRRPYIKPHRRIVDGRPWQPQHRRSTLFSRVDLALHYLCCIVVPSLFALAAWLYCICRVINSYLDS